MCIMLKLCSEAFWIEWDIWDVHCQYTLHVYNAKSMAVKYWIIGSPSLRWDTNIWDMNSF